jgi:hypothetical protein
MLQCDIYLMRTIFVTNDDASDFAESPACAVRMIIEAQRDLSPEQRDYREKMESYLEGPGHDQSA